MKINILKFLFICSLFPSLTVANKNPTNVIDSSSVIVTGSTLDSFFIFADVSLWTRVRVLWEHATELQVSKYIIERSEDSLTYFPIDSINSSPLVDIFQYDSTIYRSLDPFASIYYSTEGGNKRFLYYENQPNRILLSGITYRIRLIFTNGNYAFSRVVNLSAFINDHPIPTETFACELGSPPSEYTLTGGIIVQTDGCCIITASEFILDNCSKNPGACFPLGWLIDCKCACDCKRDGCCEHTCGELCGCQNWTSSGCSGGCAPAIWVVTGINIISIPLNLTPTSSTLCVGSSLTLTASGGTTYTWSPSAGLNATTGAVVIASPTTSTSYTVTTSDGFQCFESVSVNVVVNPVPTVSINALPQSVCVGEQINFLGTVSGGVTPYSFFWNLGDNNTANTQGFSYIYNASGIYTVTLTLIDANGCSATASVSVSVYDYPPLPTISPANSTLCLGPTVQYSITNFDASLVYSISTNPSTGVIITPVLTGVWNVTFPSTCTTDYTITILSYNGLAACSSSATVTAFKCCPCSLSGADIQVSGSQLNPYLASTLQSVYSSYFNGNTYQNNSGTLYINGFFLVDIPLTIKNSNVRFGGNARVDVTANITFTLEKAHLAAGCNYMWDGIYVDNLTETVVSDKSLFEDALNAIVSENGGVFTLFDKTKFNKNYIGIIARNYAGSHGGSYQKTEFVCYQNATIPIPANALIAPYAGQRSRMGIEVVDVQDISLGTAINGQTSYFDYMDVGIHTLRSSSTIYNNNFSRITAPSIQISNVINGVAIWAEGDPNLFNFGGYILNVGDIIPASQNVFSGGGSGIFAHDRISVYVKNNRFSNLTGTGIYITRLYEGNVIEIRDDNRLNTMPNGIWCYDNPLTPITIFDNRINLSAQPFFTGNGIMIQELVPQNNFLKTTLIQNNTIQSVRHGIFINNLWNRTTVIGNKIASTNTGYGQGTEGIYASNCKKIVVTQNEVWSITGSRDWWMNGIRMQITSSENMITCNDVHDIGRGLFFDGTQVLATGVARNDMTDLETGLLLNYGEIGQQGFTGTPYDNTWNGSFTYAHTFAWVIDGGLSPFKVRPGLPWQPTVNQQFLGFPIPFTTTTATNPLGACPLFNVPFPINDEVQKALGIINESVDYLNYDQAQKWMSKYNLYHRFLLDTAFLNADPRFIAFKDSVDNSNMGKIYEITFKTCDKGCTYDVLAATQVTNGGIVTDHPLEVHFKTINTLLLQHRLDGTELDSVEINIVRAIASLCPLSDGPAVHYARAIVFKYDNQIVDYSSSCESVPDQSQNRTMAQTQPVELMSGLYPNPNNGMMTLLYILPEQTNASFSIFDLNGKCITVYTLNPGENSLSIDQSILQNGVYIYEIKQGDALLKKDKIVIVK